MLVVVASARDEQARALPRQWAPHDVAILTASDLSSAGWKFSPAEPQASAGVVDGELVPLAEISGVLVRLPSITQRDLPQIASAERDYVAAEMTAFLIAVLASLRCVVLNPPTSPLLTSPAWRVEQWLAAAARRGVPTVVQPARGEGHPPSAACAVTVIGSRCVGTVDDQLCAQARLLARAGDVTLLVARFVTAPSGWVFAGADPWADLGDESVSAALLSHLAIPAAEAAGAKAPA